MQLTTLRHENNRLSRDRSMDSNERVEKEKNKSTNICGSDLWWNGSNILMDTKWQLRDLAQLLIT